MKRFLSLLMAICLMVTICVPGASAAETTDDAATALDSRIIVTQGVRPFVGMIKIYPALRTGSKTDINEKAYGRYYFTGSSTAKGLQLSPAETETLLNKYRTATGNEPNAWVISVRYDLVTDGKGSYGKYFEWEPWGDLYEPKVESNGKVKEIVAPYTGDSSYTYTSAFSMPEDTSGTYRMGLQGGFWYYCAPAAKILSIQSGFLVSFNYTK